MGIIYIAIEQYLEIHVISDKQVKILNTINANILFVTSDKTACWTK